MIALSPDDEHVVLINTFVVDPDRCEELLALLSRATEEVIRQLPGFVSANLHKSLDGTRVANYAQWKSVGALVEISADRSPMRAHAVARRNGSIARLVQSSSPMN